MATVFYPPVIIILFAISSLLSGCSSGGDSNDQSGPPPLTFNVSGYLNRENANNYSFDGYCIGFNGRELTYTISQEGLDDPIEGSVSCEDDVWEVQGIPLSSLDEGDFTIEISAISITATITITKDTTPPVLIGLSDDDTPTKSKTWAWECEEDTSCEYRHVVTPSNDAPPHSFPDTHLFAGQTTLTKSSETGTFFLHVQARDKAGNQSEVATVSAILDNTPPELPAIEVPWAGTYGMGGNLTFTVTYNENVTLDGGTPFIELTVGTATKNATYVAEESSGGVLVFRYDIVTNDLDGDGVQWNDSEIKFTGGEGSIQDQAGNHAPATGFSLPSLSSILVDHASSLTLDVRPYLNDENDHSYDFGGNCLGFNGQTLTYTISQQSLATDLTGSASCTNGIWEIQGLDLSTDLSDGEFTLAISSTTSVTASATIIKDTASPELLGLTNDDIPTNNKVWNWQCNSDPTCEYRHVITDNNDNPPYVFADNHNYDTKTSFSKNSGNGTFYLHVQGKDQAGNESTVTTVSAVIDTTAPSLPTILVPENKIHRLGSHLTFTVTYNENITLEGGEPFIELTIGTSPQNATYVAAESSGGVLIFRYDIAPNDLDEDGIHWNDSEIKFTGGQGSIQDQAGNHAPTTGLTIPSLSGVLVDYFTSLTFNTLNYLNVDNATSYDFGGDCVGFDGESLNYTISQQGLANPITGTASCTSGIWEVLALDLSTKLSDGEFTIEISSSMTMANATIIKDTVAPELMALSDDDTPKRSKTWNWPCDSDPTCRYRHAITPDNNNPPYAFSESHPYDTQNTFTKDSGDGTFYLHVQAIDNAGNESEVITVSMLIDNTVPLPPTVTVPSDGTYTPEQELIFTIVYNEDIVVNGTPHLALTIGTTPKRAEYVEEESSARTLIFSYEAVGSDFDNDGIAWDNAISFTGVGSIEDVVGHTAPITNLTVPSLTAVLINGDPISLTNVTSPIGHYKAGDDIILTAHFNRNVIVTGRPQLTLQLTGISGEEVTATFSGTEGSIGSSNTHQFTYTVGAGHNSNTIDFVRLDPNGGSIQDDQGFALEVVNNRIRLNALTVDTIAPLAPTVEVPNPGVYTDDEYLIFTITYDEPVNIYGTPHLALTIGSTPVQAELRTRQNRTTLTFRYQIQDTELDNDGIEWDNAIGFTGLGSVKDRAGNPAPITSLTVPSLSEVQVNGAAIPITRIEAPTGHYKALDVITLTAHFVKDVTVSGIPKLNLRVGEDETIEATFSGTTGTAGSSNSHSFTYTVQAGHNDNNGIHVIGLDVSGGATIQGGANNTPAAFGGEDHLSEVKVDTVVPANPTLSTLPASPSNYPTPSLIIYQLIRTDIIKAYQNNNCSGTPFTEQTVNGGNLAEILVPTALSTDGAYNFSVKIADLAENESSCITLAHTFDSTVNTVLPDPMVSAGGYHTCALSKIGLVKCWGDGHKGSLGQGGRNDIGKRANEMGNNLAPIDLGTVDSADSTSTPLTAKAISTGYQHTCALVSNDQVKCWGKGSDGQLGQGNTDNIGDGPNEMGNNLRIVDLGTDSSNNALTAKAISSGDEHTCVLLTNNSIKCWGYGVTGILGQENGNMIGDDANEMGNNLAFINLGTDSSNNALTAKAISINNANTCALLNNNKIKCWGYNNYGQLGLGSAANVGVGDELNEMGNNLAFINLGIVDPDDSESATLTAKAVRVGRNYICALLTNNSIKCWGDGLDGKLGQGNTDNIGDGPNEMGNNLDLIDLGTLDPTDSESASFTAKAVSTGDYHVCALLNNHSIKCWGRGNYGQLGQGNINSIGNEANEMGDNFDPIDLGTIDPTDSESAALTAKVVSAGRNHTCALLNNNSIKCWGNGNYGRLGQGNRVSIGDEADEMGNNLLPIDLGGNF